jgi:hypothetical protein
MIDVNMEICSASDCGWSFGCKRVDFGTKSRGETGFEPFSRYGFAFHISAATTPA